ncbi:hypothetical protein [Halorubrum sp. SD612]|uniref:DUF7845 domain-containing protein n=1 Tax=Halorubrum sp. SD612 TaxID=1855863 RepID=UPI000A2D9A6E|nr:hypothetical protein [Halorubrum sp. SD612]OTF10610.1 hypothetical protein B9G38_05260 [Halorubrum sp. SD612]
MSDDYLEPGPQGDLDELLGDAQPVTGDDEDSIEGVVDSEEARELRDAASEGTRQVHPSSPESTEYRTFDVEGPIECVEPRVHAFGAHLLFSQPDTRQNGHPGSLSPYDAIVSQYEPTIADDIGSFVFDGELWEINPDKTNYWSGGIAAPSRPYETFNEYQIAVRAQDGLGERKASFQFRPSVPDARTADGERIGSMPEDLPYGLRVQSNSSNLEPDEVIPLLRRLAEELDISTHYFRDECVHEHSNAYQMEMYLRLDRGAGEQHVAGQGAVLDQLALFGSNNRGKGEYKWDNEKVIGHRNAVALDESTWKKLTEKPNGVGKLVKYYHPEFARSEETSSADDPLSDPKLELQWSKDYSDRASVPWSEEGAFDVEALRTELDESLVNVLLWAGLPTRADPRIYTADHYFEATESERDLDLVENKMPSVQEGEEQQAVAHFARGDATESERSVLAALTDGGDGADVEQLAELSDTSRSTVYRAAEKFDDLVEVANAKMSFEDSLIREKFQDLLNTFEDITDWVVGGVRQLASAETEMIDQDSALARWARRHGISITESVDGMVVDLGGQPLSRVELVKLIRAGVDAAEDTGSMAYRKFISGEFSWTEKEEGRRTGQRPINRNGDVLFSSKLPR